MEGKNKEKIKGINWYATFIFNNLTKYGWCVSGDKVTRAKMFYDMQKIPLVLSRGMTFSRLTKNH
ncbi:MAG: BREX system Lon protease-like protein BrxL [Leptospiraceae bacterium]|nr:BREX system Lon protease-like protein BrxL [Leptospiraceae bacterium]